MSALLGLLFLAASPGHDSASRVLERELPSPDDSYLLLELPDGGLRASRFAGADQPAPLGSLTKPFVALAYGAGHDFRFPQRRCESGCWRPGGHGPVGVVQAIAHSCNVYFRELAAAARPEDLSAVALRYGLSEDWQASPLTIARAYAELAVRSAESGVPPLLEGMRRCALEGTGRAAGEPALLKTGTAPCVHPRRAPGDGYAVAMFPPEHPRLLLLLRVHGAPGSEAARRVGQMIRLLR